MDLRGRKLDFSGYLEENQRRINHFYASKLCKLQQKSYNFTISINEEQDTNAVCDSFLSFVSFNIFPLDFNFKLQSLGMISITAHAYHV